MALYDRDVSMDMYGSLPDGTALLSPEQQKDIFIDIIKHTRERDKMTDLALNFYISLNIVRHQAAAVFCLDFVARRKRGEGPKHCTKPVDKTFQAINLTQLWSLAIACPDETLWAELYGLTPAFFCTSHGKTEERKELATHFYGVIQAFRRANGVVPAARIPYHQSTMPQQAPVIKTEHKNVATTLPAPAATNAMISTLLSTASQLATLDQRMFQTESECLLQALGVAAQTFRLVNRADFDAFLVNMAAKAQTAHSEDSFHAQEVLDLTRVFGMAAECYTQEQSRTRG